MARSDRPARSARAQPASGAALVAALLLAILGLVLSAMLVRLHARAHAGFTSFCAISETVNCDRVAMSRWSVFLGLPVALWGAFGYGAAAALAGGALASARAGGRRLHGLLVAVAAVAVAVSVALALVSELVIGAWCLLCIASWVTSAALLVAAWRASPEGPATAVAADVRRLRARPGRTAAIGLALLALLVGVRAAYPRYWKASAAPRTAGSPTAPAQPPAPGALGAPGAPGAKRVVVEFSDYACPFCARAHEGLAALRAAHPELEIVRRNFPLDSRCNPAVKRDIHPGACVLARAGICAAAQGKFAAMDDALFANQEAKVPVAELAGRLGLDVPAFEVCLASPETERRLASDIADALRLGVKATPSYVVDGQVFAGELPPGLAGSTGPARAP